MKLSSIQTPASHASPPPPMGWPVQKIPNEPIFPPNPNQIQPLTTSGHEPVSQPNPLPPACAFPALAGIVEEDTSRAMQSPVLSREEELYWLGLKLTDTPGVT